MARPKVARVIILLLLIQVCYSLPGSVDGASLDVFLGGSKVQPPNPNKQGDFLATSALQRRAIQGHQDQHILRREENPGVQHLLRREENPGVQHLLRRDVELMRVNTAALIPHGNNNKKNIEQIGIVL